MCNQILACNNMIGMTESLLYAHRAGLDQEGVIRAIGAGAAGSWAVNNLGYRVVHRDFAPGFMIEHMAKDLGIALSEAERMGSPFPVSSSHSGCTTAPSPRPRARRHPGADTRSGRGRQVWMAVGEAGVKGEVRLGVAAALRRSAAYAQRPHCITCARVWCLTLVVAFRGGAWCSA